MLQKLWGGVGRGKAFLLGDGQGWKWRYTAESNIMKMEAKAMKRNGKVKRWIKEHSFELELAGALTLGFVAGWILGKKGVQPRDAIKLVKPPRIGAGKMGHSAFVNPTTTMFSDFYKDSHINLKNANDIVEAAAELCNGSASEMETYASSVPFEVSQHIRNLHEGWEASPTKVAEAAAMGIRLLPGQTLVNAYKKGLLAA